MLWICLFYYFLSHFRMFLLYRLTIKFSFDVVVIVLYRLFLSFFFFVILIQEYSSVYIFDAATTSTTGIGVLL